MSYILTYVQYGGTPKLSLNSPPPRHPTWAPTAVAVQTKIRSLVRSYVDATAVGVQTKIRSLVHMATPPRLFFFCYLYQIRIEFTYYFAPPPPFTSSKTTYIHENKSKSHRLKSCAAHPHYYLPSPPPLPRGGWRAPPVTNKKRGWGWDCSITQSYGRSFEKVDIIGEQ